MRKGAIPIQYIIALILGIAVIAILGYYFFIRAGSIERTGLETRCNSLKFKFCNEWKMGLDPPWPPPEESACGDLISERELEDQCPVIIGGGYCSGTPNNCNKYNRKQSDCLAVGCDFNVATGVCSGTPNPCSVYKSWVECQRYGCTWSS